MTVGLATDIGAGTSFSLLQTIHEAYKIQQLRGDQLSPLKSFYLATLGGARTLDLDSKIGNFEQGKEADFIVLDYKSTPLSALRSRWKLKKVPPGPECSELSQLIDKLFALAILGDDRAVKATYVLGESAYLR